jgi:hypothetical protein
MLLKELPNSPKGLKKLLNSKEAQAKIPITKWRPISLALLIELKSIQKTMRSKRITKNPLTIYKEASTLFHKRSNSSGSTAKLINCKTME